MGGGGTNVSVGLLALLALFGPLELLCKFKPLWERWISYAIFLVIIWIFLAGLQARR